MWQWKEDEKVLCKRFPGSRLISLGYATQTATVFKRETQDRTLGGRSLDIRTLKPLRRSEASQQLPKLYKLTLSLYRHAFFTDKIIRYQPEISLLSLDPTYVLDHDGAL